MKHPFPVLQAEYESWVAGAEVRPECRKLVDSIAERLLAHFDAGHYVRVSTLTNIPIIWMATSFEREASSNFRLNPAQGDPLDSISTHVPRGLGPYAEPGAWDKAALVAYHIDGIDLVGPGWTWARACYEWEAMNGFGYRDFHRMRSPYVVGGTVLQQKGKYESDGKFNSEIMDSQIGCLPIAQAMVDLEPNLDLAGAIATAKASAAPFPSPSPSTIAEHLHPDHEHDVEWLQGELNKLLDPSPELDVDGNYGKFTRNAVRLFQQKNKLDVDGIAGPATIAVLEKAAAAFSS
jgi:lysozyme family protein